MVTMIAINEILVAQSYAVAAIMANGQGVRLM